MTEFTPGTLINPNVRLVRLLGVGGMGSVWVADHLSLQTQVAVKFISPELVKADPNIIARFNREATISAQIKSPHVVQTFDHGVMDAETPFIVMELLEGESLEDRVDRAGPLSLADTGLVVTQTAKALNKAHKLSVVHRDIKPDNLFLVDADDELFVKVLDFGVAKHTHMPSHSVVTSTGTMVGTPEYMSPEQVLSAKGVDHRADLWALGVVAYYALTGEVPFSGETLGSLCVAIAGAQFVPASQLRAALPKPLDQWFSRALQPDPANRFSSAKQMALSLSQIIADPTHPIRDDFSEDGSGSVDLAEWTGEHAAVGTKQPSGVANAATVAGSSSATFSGAALRAGPERRRVSWAALSAIAAVAALIVGVVLVIMLGGDEGSSSTAQSASGAPSFNARKETRATAGVGVEQSAEATTTANTSAVSSASAEPSSSASATERAAPPTPLTKRPTSPKPIAPASSPSEKATATPPLSPPAPPQPPATATSDATTTSSAATEKNRGF